MFLVDTSVWIDYLCENETGAVAEFRRILETEQPFGITPVILQEVLQGAESNEDFERLLAYMSTQRLYFPEDLVLSHLEAARLYQRCRRAGVTIRSTIDCLIARIAIEHDLVLIHSDRDFDHLAKVVPDLRTL